MGKKNLLLASLFLLLTCVNDLQAQTNNGSNQQNTVATTTFKATIVTNTSTSNTGYIVIIETVSNTDPDDTFEYSLDGINYQSSPVFTGLSAGDYTIYVRNELGQVATQRLFLGVAIDEQ